MSICPKNKSSKGRRDRRRANWKMKAPNLVKCSKCGALMMPHRVCNCGSRKREHQRDLRSIRTSTNLHFQVSATRTAIPSIPLQVLRSPKPTR